MTMCAEIAYENYCTMVLFVLQTQTPSSYKLIELRHVKIYHFHENPFSVSYQVLTYSGREQLKVLNSYSN